MIAPCIHQTRRRKRCRWGLSVKPMGKAWFRTALRFDPDTCEIAAQYGQKLVDTGHIEAFEVMDRFPNRGA